MATLIEQKPLYNTLPVGQDIIFAISNTGIVSTKPRVKFIAEVHISSTNPANQNTSTDLIGTFKTTPNNAGVGIFDLSSVVESYVKADNTSGIFGAYKGTLVTSLTQDIIPPIHLIDKFSVNSNIIRWLTVRFKIEYYDDTTNAMVVSSQDTDSEDYKIFNGYLKHTDSLDMLSSDFGYSMTNFQLGDSNKRFLTNASVTQYANIEDYGTVALLDPNNKIEYVKFNYLNVLGASIGSDDVASGFAISSLAKLQILYLGCFPANLRNWSSTFQALVTADTIKNYTVQAFDDTDTAVSKVYTININCPDLKNYESIRLAWLNQWGAWDYYTFTKKSVRSLSTKGSTYTQQSGTWNEAKYRPKGFKGGMKSFRVNATEKIKMNTDFVNETESEWFEELINSPEVYVLEGYQSDTPYPLLNTYVTPVRLLTSSYIRKTIANDRLMQFTFEVEKSKTLRTQAV